MQENRHPCPFSVTRAEVRPSRPAAAILSVEQETIALRNFNGHNHCVLVPDWVWRGGAVSRAVCLGLAVGVFSGALVFAESGSVLGALIVVAVISPFYGIVMARRMTRFWPSAKELSGEDRVAVARAARRGETIGETHLAPSVIEYSGGLRQAHRQARRYRWVVWLFGAVAFIFALTDSFFGPVRLALVSWVVVGCLAVELLWWPRKQAHISFNAERAENSARQVWDQRAAGDH